MKALLPVALAALLLVSCASRRDTASAEEYFSLGMAYFDLGKYEEAERWLNRARSVDKTKTASEYNLGRIAFETGRYADAASYFERVLQRDGENVMALKAAAYARIQNGDLERAGELYNRVLAMVPESADSGYNYALVLFALKKYPEAEETLLRYRLNLDDNSAALLLLARTQKALGKVEAVDSYERWLSGNSGARPRYEYAQALEAAEFYARALEEYRTAINALPSGSGTSIEGLTKAEVQFSAARLTFIADSGNSEAMTIFRAALEGGFSDEESLAGLLSDRRITENRKAEIRRVITEVEDARKKAAEEPVPE